MEYFEFVCHASEYFWSYNSCCNIHTSSVEPGFIWTTLKSENLQKFGALEDLFESDNQNALSSKLGNKDLGNNRYDSLKRQVTKVEKKLKLN